MTAIYWPCTRAKMKPTQTLIIHFVDEREEPLRLANIYIDLLFYVGGRYCYGFRFGPSNTEGELHIAYQDVENARVREAKFNLMDYNTPIVKCDDRLKIKIPSAEELKEAYEWQVKSLTDGASTEAKNWLDSANSKIKCNDTFIEVKEKATNVSIQCSMDNLCIK
jgi:hypothetical protein